MNTQQTHSVIPAGELRCVWMEAGITSFKLCDQELRCEACKFNAAIQKRIESQATHAQHEPQGYSLQKGDERAMTADALFQKILQKHLERLKKVELPQDRTYNRSHFWIQQIKSGKFRIGINHVTASLFHPILSIVFLRTPTSIFRHDPFCWIVIPGGALTFRSPIDATISRFNPALQIKPKLLSTAPFEQGWLMELNTKPKNLNDFTSSSDVNQFIERMFLYIEYSFIKEFRNLNFSTGTTLFNGGFRLNSMESILGPKAYLAVINRILHVPL